jgi:hypothetical protein
MMVVMMAAMTEITVIELQSCVAAK